MRIVPLYHFVLFVEYFRVTLFGGVSHPFSAWPANALFLQAFFPIRVCGAPEFMHLSNNIVGWFAACMVWISVCHPFLYNSRPRAGFAATLAALVAVVICRALVEVLLQASVIGAGPSVIRADQAIVLHSYGFLPVRLLEYAAGMLSSQAVSELPQEMRARLRWDWVFDGVLVACLAGAYGAVHLLGASRDLSGEYYLTPCWCLLCAIARLAAEAPSGSQNEVRSIEAPFYMVLRSAPLRALAPYTYGVYITHVVFQRCFWHLLLALPWSMPSWSTHSSFPLWKWSFMGASWVVGALATDLIERPLQRVAQQLVRKSPSAPRSDKELPGPMKG